MLEKQIPQLRKALTDSTTKLAVETKSIPQGPNNKLTSNVKFAFDMQSYKVAHLMMTDNDNKRFEIPENVVPKAAASETMRLDMVGFTYNLNPFEFSFTDATDKTNVFVTTKNQTLVVMDKFI